MERMITFDELPERLNIKENQIFTLFHEGLKPYNIAGKPEPTISWNEENIKVKTEILRLKNIVLNEEGKKDELDRILAYKQILDEELENNSGIYSWQFFRSLPVNAIEGQRLFSILRVCQFKESDVIELANRLHLKFEKSIISNVIVQSNHHDKPAKKLRPCQKAKIECQALARSIMSTSPDLNIRELSEHPSMTGIGYDTRTRHSWIKEIVPQEKHKPGRPRIKT
jgi:hypothetical protein